MKRVWTALFAALLLPVMVTGGCMADSIPAGTTAGLEQAAVSVVRLEVYDSSGALMGTGSGFAAFDPPVLITAYHVIADMAYMIATRDDGTSFRVESTAVTDETTDIAVCLLPDDAGLEPLPLAADLPVRGEWSAVIGSQFGLVNLVTLGNVCGIWRTDAADLILFTAPVSAGCSGGPLLNAADEVIGVVIGTYDKGQNLNIAVPADILNGLWGNSR